MNILFGHYTPDKGDISLEGQQMTFGNTGNAISHGIGMVHQHFTLAENLTVLDNIIKFKQLGFPVLIGLSRKSFLAVGDDKPEDRKSASLAAQSIAISNGADCIRTHDVEETYRTL